jgi:succinyl-CoA synthetase beta subunit
MLLEYMAAKKLLSKYGIDSIESAYVEDTASAIEFSNKVGGTIVLKAISEKALHKSKAGLVMLNIAGDNEIRKAFNELSKRANAYAPYKILAQKMAGSGIEIIIGSREDVQFGKLILVGLGGVFVESFKDFAVRVCPITRYDALEMIAQLKSKNVVTYNGKAEDAVISMLMKASKMIEDNNINELDLNPVIVREKDYDVVDIRIIK